MSKVYYTILIVFLVSFFSCTKTNKQEAKYQATQDSIKKYLDIAKNETLPFEKRDLYNSKAFGLIAKGENDKSSRDSLFSISFKLYKEKKWSIFNKLSQIHLKMALEKNDSVNIVKAYRYRAGYFKHVQFYDSSFYYYLKAEKIYLNTDDKLNYANILYNKGIVQNAICDYFGAELSLSKAYYLFIESEEKEKLFGVQNELGLVCNSLKDFERAIKYFNEAIETVKENQLENENHQTEICLSNLGFVYQNQKKYTKAIYYYNESLKSKKIKNDTPELYSNIIDNLAFCESQIGISTNLPKLFFEALKIRKNLGLFSSELISNNHLSEYYFKIKDFSNAVKFSNKSLSIAKETKNPIDYLTALEQAASVDKNNASKYLEEYIRINDSLQLAERKTKNQFLKIQLETNEITQEKENAIKQKWVLASIIAGVLIIVILLFVIYFQRTKQKELKLLQSQQIANEETYQIMLKQQEKEEYVRQQEKKRIALELHDNIMNKLASTRHNLFTLTKVSEEETAKKAAFYIDKIHDVENEIRSLSHDLTKDAFSDTNSFIKLLNELIKTNTESYDTLSELEIESTIDWDLVSGYIKMQLYRIIQEGLHNCNKHAKASKITISIIQDGKNLCMTIEDNGVGFNTKEVTKGIGLKNIKERIELLGGRCSIHSDLSHGTKLVMALPTF